MSEKEIRRAGTLGRVKTGEATQKEAAEILCLSYRQTRRLWQRYRAQGAEGLVHGNAGKPSHHGKPKRFRQRVLALVRKHYGGERGKRFGPTLAAEHLLEENGLAIDAETLRRWMLAEGLWSRERKRKPYRQRRTRKEHFGELVQMDGSFDDWLEERGPRGCWLGMVDDATSISNGCFDAEETTWAAADTLRSWVEQYGIPRALYLDWKSVYHSAPTRRQRERGEVPISQFGRMCAKLGIELIGASSAQAKGRVERNHGTHQDRLIKKLRRKRIGDYEQANQYVRQEYLPAHNARYAVAPASAVDFHEPVPAGLDLDQVFCLEYERVVSNDWVVQYDNRWFQLEAAQPIPVPAGSQVTVRIGRDGRIKLLYQNQTLRWRKLAERPKAEPRVRPLVKRPAVGHKPAADHPWRRGFAVAPPAPPKKRETGMDVGEEGWLPPSPTPSSPAIQKGTFLSS
jgi:transposase